MYRGLHMVNVLAKAGVITTSLINYYRARSRELENLQEIGVRVRERVKSQARRGD